jgi:hypothetical protein
LERLDLRNRLVKNAFEDALQTGPLNRKSVLPLQRDLRAKAQGLCNVKRFLRAESKTERLTMSAQPVLR